MKTKKLNLNDLKVESFVTSMEDKKVNTVKGGSGAACSVSLVSVTIYSIVKTLNPTASR